MDFRDEQSYKNYFESLAISHVDIAEFTFGDAKVFSNVQKSAKESNAGFVLWLDYYQPIQGAGSHDNHVGRLTAEWVIMKPASSKQLTNEGKQAIALECEEVAQQVFAKIMHDYQTYEGEEMPNEPDWVTMRFGRMESHTFGSTSYEGTACELTFSIPLKTELNLAKWQ